MIIKVLPTIIALLALSCRFSHFSELEELNSYCLLGVFAQNIIGAAKQVNTENEALIMDNSKFCNAAVEDISTPNFIKERCQYLGLLNFNLNSLQNNTDIPNKFVQSNVDVLTDMDIRTNPIYFTAEHNSKCFTQGLTFYNETVLIESCGLYNSSKLDIYHFDTEKLNKLQNMGHFLSPNLLHHKGSYHFDANVFSEGITFGEKNRLYSLTWKEHIIYEFEFNGETLHLIQQYPYIYEGWGLTYNPLDKIFYASNGTSYINQFKIDLETFKLQMLPPRQIICNNQPLEMINELEFDAKSKKVYSNVWYDYHIYELDLEEGVCTEVFDYRMILENNNVLNGIVKEKNSDFYWVTGKNWKYLHQTNFKQSSQPVVIETSSNIRRGFVA